MEQLLGVMNKLMRVFAQANVPNIQLPRIAVVGSQSSGKSSVIEAIVQRDFLPRGSGIVTRRPLVLHLVNESRNADKTEWGEFGHQPGKRILQFPLIRSEIERVTDQEAGNNKGISDKPIFLTIHSPNVVDLILVDLPGLTKVAVGDQPKDIEKQVRDLIESYIKEPLTIILAVSPGNVDLANSDALKLSHKWDPEGNRTLGVITKLDLLDQGTDAADMLQNRVIPLRLGYVGLVMRSQKDISEDKDVKLALKDEEAFFRQHYAYQSFSDRCGTAYLGKTLSKMLLSHVQRFLPDTRNNIQTSVRRIEAELSKYGASPEEQGGFGSVLLRIISEFSNKYAQKLEGEVSDSELEQLKGGARINRVFKELFIDDLSKTNMELGMTEEELFVQMRNSLGVNSALFVPEKCFYQISVKQIERLRAPSLRCLEVAHLECLQLLRTTLTTVDGLERYPKLRLQLIDETTKLLAGMKVSTAEMVNNLIDIEEAYINTRHPEFDSYGCLAAIVREQDQSQQGVPGTARKQDSGLSGAGGGVTTNLGQPPQRTAPRAPADGGSNTDRDQDRGGQGGNPGTDQYNILVQTLTASDSMKVEIVRRLVLMYYNIVRKNIADSAPKAIMHFLVNKSRQNMQNELMTRLYKESLFSSLLAEDEDVSRRRTICLQRLKVLKEAMGILDELSFSSTFYELGQQPMPTFEVPQAGATRGPTRVPERGAEPPRSSPQGSFKPTNGLPPPNQPLGQSLQLPPQSQIPPRTQSPPLQQFRTPQTGQQQIQPPQQPTTGVTLFPQIAMGKKR